MNMMILTILNHTISELNILQIMSEQTSSSSFPLSIVQIKNKHIICPLPITDILQKHKNMKDYSQEKQNQSSSASISLPISSILSSFLSSSSSSLPCSFHISSQELEHIIQPFNLRPD